MDLFCFVFFFSKYLRFNSKISNFFSVSWNDWIYFQPIPLIFTRGANSFAQCSMCMQNLTDFFFFFSESEMWGFFFCSSSCWIISRSYQLSALFGSPAGSPHPRLHILRLILHLFFFFLLHLFLFSPGKRWLLGYRPLSFGWQSVRKKSRLSLFSSSVMWFFILRSH